MYRGTIPFELFQLVDYWRKTMSIGLPDGIESEKIAYGPHPKQYMMTFKPSVVDKKKPLIIYYHGGGWIFGKPELFSTKASLFTSLGYQVVMPSYRKLPKYTADEIIEDIVLCTKHLHVLKSKGKIYNLDQIILGGVSAGANLVSLLYFNKDMHREAGFQQDQFKGMFLYAPPIDLTKMKRTPVLRRYAGLPSSERFVRANPISFIEDSIPVPILCVHGNKDAMVQIESSKSFQAAYDKLYPEYLKYSEIENGCHLDSASWAHTDNDMRKELVHWLLSFG